jgi:hypothetical protein
MYYNGICTCYSTHSIGLNVHSVHRMCKYKYPVPLTYRYWKCPPPTSHTKQSMSKAVYNAEFFLSPVTAISNRIFPFSSASA